MEMIPTDRPKVNDQKRTRNRDILEEFVNSGEDCVLLKDCKHKSAASFQASLLNSIRYFDIKNVSVVVRGEKIYLLRK